MLRKFFKRKDSAAAPPSTQVGGRDLLHSLGDDRVQQSDYNGAVVMYDEALKHAPDDVTLLLSRSFAHMMSTPPRFELALRDADSAIQLDATGWKGWMQKGETHLRMGDINAAEGALENAVKSARGVNKLAAQKSLADAQSRRGLTSSAVGTSGEPSSPGKLTYPKPTCPKWNRIKEKPPGTPLIGRTHLEPKSLLQVTPRICLIRIPQLVLCHSRR